MFAYLLSGPGRRTVASRIETTDSFNRPHSAVLEIFALVEYLTSNVTVRFPFDSIRRVHVGKHRAEQSRLKASKANIPVAESIRKHNQSYVSVDKSLTDDTDETDVQVKLCRTHS